MAMVRVVSLASALFFTGYEDFAKEIIERSAKLGRYFGRCNTFIGIITSVCSKFFWVRRDQNYHLNPFRHDLEFLVQESLERPKLVRS